MSLAFLLLDADLMCWNPPFGLQHLVNFYCLRILTCVLFFAVRYSLNPLIKRNHFGHMAVLTPFLFNLQKTAPVFTGINDERQARLTRGSVSTLQELISNGRFESVSRHLLMKPGFLFGDVLMKMSMFCSMDTISCFIKLESVTSFSLTWNRCFHCHTCGPCLFAGTWTGTGT